MKRFIPLLILALFLAFVAKTLLPPKNPGTFDVVGFGQLPVLANGRIKPLDTIARSSLLQLQRRQPVRTPLESEPLVAHPVEWLLDVIYRPEKADTYPTFAIDHPDLLTLIGKSEESVRIEYPDTTRRVLAIFGFIPNRHRRFSFNEIWPHREVIQNRAQQADQVEAALRTPFQRAVLQLYANLHHYQRLQHAFVMPGQPDFLGDLLRFQDQVAAGVEAVRAKQAGRPHDEAVAQAMITMGRRFSTMEQVSMFLVIPPDAGEADPNAWRTAGEALLETFRTGRVDPSALAHAGFARSWREQDANRFNELLRLFRNSLEKNIAPQLAKAAAEARFNAAQPFYTSMTIYAVAFFVGIFAWLFWPETLGRSAFYLVALAWIVATAGIATRMWLEGRPPVTNLYSSALFVGWGAVALCLVLEYIFKNAVGSVTASAMGFATLMIAHHLSLSGDTLEMMRAVLDSNFWLATHVIVVTAGYSATFLAGFLATVYILMGLTTKWLSRSPTWKEVAVVPATSPLGESTGHVAKAGTETNAKMLERMVYGIVCFATLFSFTGTVLGGIWADQSWGRFWGWDPKENGALLIVIWNAIILHARWGGMIKPRGLMCLAVGGNIVTSWSWFGTNMLGVGLHSYGFTDAAFTVLMAFWAAWVAIIALGNIPLEKWRSFGVVRM